MDKQRFVKYLGDFNLLFECGNLLLTRTEQAVEVEASLANRTHVWVTPDAQQRIFPVRFQISNVMGVDNLLPAEKEQPKLRSKL